MAADKMIFAAEKLPEGSKKEANLNLADDILTFIEEVEKLVEQRGQVKKPIGIGSYMRETLERTGYKLP